MMNKIFFSLKLSLILLLSGCLSNTSNPGKLELNDKKTQFPPVFSQNSNYNVMSNTSNVHLATLPTAVTKDGDLPVYQLETLPIKGSISHCLGLNNTQTSDLECIYTPKANFSGTDTLIYSAKDKYNNKTFKSVPIYVSLPTAAIFPTFPITSVWENSTNNILPTLPLATSNVDLTYSLVSLPTHGILKDCLTLVNIENDFDCTYTPTSDYYGTDSFTYKAVNANGVSTLQTVTLNVMSLTNPPSVDPTSISVSVKMNVTTPSSIDVTPTTITHLNNLPLNYSIVTPPTKGNLTHCLNLASSSGRTDTTCKYQPHPDIYGADIDSFIYKIQDNAGVYTLITVLISVTNNTPIANDQNLNAIIEETPYTFNLDITDADGLSDIVKIEGHTPLNGFGLFKGVIEGVGTLSQCMGLNSTSITDTSCIFTPVTDFVGTGQLTYKVYDASGASDSATITFTINNGPDAPVLADQTFTLRENSGANIITISAPSDIDSSYETPTNTYSVTVSPTKGVLSSCFTSGSLKCTYTPTANLNGTDTMTVQVTDNNGLTDTAIITINITSTNRFPVTTNQTFTFLENSGANAFTVSPAQDLDGDSLIYSFVTASVALSGCMNSDSDLTCSYTPIANAYGSPADFAIYQVNDQAGGVSTGILFFNITSTNSTPLSAGTQNIQVGQLLTAQAITLNGTTDPDTDTLTYTLTRRPTKGVLSACLDLLNSASSADLNCNYSINNGQSTATTANFDSFTYTATDPEGASVTLNVTIEIVATDKDPVILSSELVTTTIVKNQNLTNLNVYVDEGGDSYENSQILEVCVDSSNLGLIPLANITLFYKGASIGANNCTALPDLPEAASISSDVYPVVIGITPTVNVTGTSTLTFKTKQTTGVTTYATKTVDITVLDTPSTKFHHRGWNKIIAKGFKTYLDSTETITIVENPSVEIGWNDFVAKSGITDTISKYRIYRSDRSTQTYKYLGQVNSSTTSYSDTTVGDIWQTSSPLATNGIGRVAWYVVKAVNQDGTITETTETDTVLRVLIPPPNKILVHRWMANILQCKQLGNIMDRDNNYRCPYVGPGNTSSGGLQYYDFGHDLLVDRFEAGCPYTRTSASYVGSGLPSNSFGNDNEIYYARANGVCYRNDTGTWSALAATLNTDQTPTLDIFTSSSLAKYWHNYAYLPPLTNITQHEANGMCTSTSFNTIIKVLDATGTTWSDYIGTTAGRLMNRFEYMSASAWNPGFTHTYISFVEGGRDIDQVSKCNTEKAHGFTFNTSISTDGFPGESNNYALRTGSSLTAACSSYLGAQDLVGNVSEWTSDRIKCAQNDFCTAVSSSTDAASALPAGSLPASGPKDWRFYDSSNTAVEYEFYGNSGGAIYGPCLDSNADGNCDGGGTWSDWLWSAQSNQATNLFMPIGLPAISTVADGDLFLLSNWDTVADGPILHSDKISMNSTVINAGTVVANIGALTVGSSYDHTANNGVNAGVYSLEFHDPSIKDKTRGFRCVQEFSNP